MAHHEIAFAANHFYHVYNRAISDGLVFYKAENYVHCLNLTKRYMQRYGVNILAYCLIPNHFHFLLQQEKEIPVSKFISVLFNAYVQAVNRQLDRKGTLFQGRSKYKLIDKDEYLVHLCRYIHLNPVKAKLTKRPEDWQYSNYLEWIGLRGGEIVDEGFIAEHFSSSQEYQRFVEDYQFEELELEGVEEYVWD